MAEYWQERRIDRKQVACAWALVVVILAVMLAITSARTPECPQELDAEAESCVDSTLLREANAHRPS